MTAKKDPPGKGKDQARTSGASGAKRPVATIDLKATEVGGKAKTSQTEKRGSGKPAAESVTAIKPSSATGAAKDAKPGQASKDTKQASAPSAAGAKSSDSKLAGDAKRGDTKYAPKAAAKSPPPKKSGSGIGGMFSHLVAGLVGGFLALLGAETIAPQLGLPVAGSGSSAAVNKMQERLAALEASAAKGGDAEASPELAATLKSTQARLKEIDAVKGQVGSVNAQQAKLAGELEKIAAKVGELGGANSDSGRVARLEEQLRAIAAGANSADGKKGIAGLAAVTGKLADLEATVQNQTKALRADIAKEVTQRTSQLATASEAAKSGTARIDRELTMVKSDTAKIAQNLEALKADNKRFGDKLRAVSEQTGTMRSDFDAFKGDISASLKKAAKPADVTAAVAPVSKRLSSLEGDLEGIVKAEQSRKANAERIVLSLELANLKRALDRGQSYSDELADVAKTAGGRIDLAALERYKTQGVPTTADLLKEFRAVAHDIIDAESVPEDAGVFDRLLSGARSVVRVRKVNHKPDDNSTEAIVGRIDTALADGQLGAALEEAKKLPEKALAPAGEWLAKAEARHSVDQALGAIEGQLKESLSGAAPAAAGGKS